MNRIFSLIKNVVLISIGWVGIEPAVLQSECVGKVELAPAFIHIDVLEKGHTVKKINMGAGRAEGHYNIGQGWILKPYAIYGKGDGGELTSLSLGFGRCIPIKDKITVTPSIGFTYTWLNTTIDLDLPGLGEMEFKENFRSGSPYIGLEATYRIRKNLRITGNIQYAWCRSKVKIKQLLNDTSKSRGPILSALLEYDLNQCWSVNVGFAYNESFSREKDGLRGYGAKAGLAWWF